MHFTSFRWPPSGLWQSCTHHKVLKPQCCLAWPQSILVRNQWVKEGLCEIPAGSSFRPAISLGLEREEVSNQVLSWLQGRRAFFAKGVQPLCMGCLWGGSPLRQLLHVRWTQKGHRFTSCLFLFCMQIWSRCLAAFSTSSEVSKQNAPEVANHWKYRTCHRKTDRQGHKQPWTGFEATH